MLAQNRPWPSPIEMLTEKKHHPLASIAMAKVPAATAIVHRRRMRGRVNMLRFWNGRWMRNTFECLVHPTPSLVPHAGAAEGDSPRDSG
jgi:hypothetical protein